jgi:L-glyceraldehyde 3-phosphate reductase
MWPGPYGDWGSRKYLLASLDQSLTRLKLPYVDIFYHHRMDPETPLEETMGALATAVHSGKALYAGISNYDGPTLEKATSILLQISSGVSNLPNGMPNNELLTCLLPRRASNICTLIS